MTTGARSSTGKVLPYVLLIFILLWTLIPVGWMLLSSFKTLTDVLSPTPLLVFKPTLVNYISLVSGGNNLLSYIRSSVLAAGISTIIATTLGCLAGYGLARSSFRGKHHLAFWIISTIWGLIIAYLSFNLPFAIWIMNAFFADLPPGIEEAARVDGATRFQAFWRVALPLTAPGIVTTAILCLVFSWNDYAFAVTFTGSGSQTLPVAASQLITQTGVNWGQLTAIGTVVALPMVVVGLAVRRYLVRGLTLGAVTGE